MLVIDLDISAVKNTVYSVTQNIKTYVFLLYGTYNMYYITSMPVSGGVAVAQGQSQRLVNERLLVRFSWSACWSVLGKDIEPQAAPGVLVYELL